MRPRSLALLFAVVAGLLAFIWFYERDLPSSDERAELAKRVLPIEADEVQGLTLLRGEAAVRLERLAAEDGDEEGDGGWRLREPLDAPADGSAVDRLVDRLAGLEKSRTLDEIDAAELGLAEPRGRVVVETGDGREELLIGSEVPASSSMILGVTGRDEAYVVADGLWLDLEKPAGDWRSRDLGPDSREAIQRIALGAGEGAVALGRRGESFWVESPYVDRADKDLVSALLGEITGLRVERFADGDPRPETAMAPIEVVLEGREEALRIQVGAAVGEEENLRLLRVDDQLVEVRTDLASDLARAAEQWRSRSWSALEVYQIDRLEATDAAGTTVFERDGGDWLRDGTRVEYEAVSDLLYALTGIEAESVARADPPAGEPTLTLVLSGDEDERREVLTLYAAADGSAGAARVEGREVTLSLAEAAVADLDLKLSEARSAAESSADDEELLPLEEDS